MTLKLTVTVDTNDADYNTRITNITEERLVELLPVFEAIANFKPYRGDSVRWSSPHTNNWPIGEDLPREDLGEKFVAEIYAGILTEAQIQMFQEYCPSGGFHTIHSIAVLEVAAEQVYLK